MKRKIVLTLCFSLALGMLSACGNSKNEVKQTPFPEVSATETPAAAQETQKPEETPAATQNPEETGDEKMSEVLGVKELFNSLTLAKAYKGLKDSNPIFTQTYGADPFAMVYDGRVYIYMTHDVLEYDASGALKDNGYGKINTIRCVSTDDFVNFVDHGSIKVAGSEGAAKWANNSWAPAACWKTIDGQDKFFLYFADSGNGIGVLSADTPYGPFTDPLGHAIISRSMENCGNVAWLFDPAVIVDDDGTGYIYFGGGPGPSAEWPGMGDRKSVV